MNDQALERRRRNLRRLLVGVAVVVLAVLLVGVIVWLRAARLHENMSTYQAYFRHHSLSGLAPDSPVTMRGIEIGRVIKLQILPEDISRVRAVLRIKDYVPIKTDTRADIRRNLLTGAAGIDLIGGTNAAPLLEIPPGERHPVIQEGPAGLEEEINRSLPALLDDLKAAAENLQGFLNAENSGRVAAILKNVEVVTEGMARWQPDLETVISNLVELTENMSALSKTVDAAAEQISRSVEHGAQAASFQARGLMEHARQAATALQQTAEGLDDPEALLFGQNPEALGPGEKKGGNQ
jgi:phospholipid/cholesterol/gamma-HCH transport system substrate-binding protein